MTNCIHEFTLAYDDLPRSYLVKQKRSELNKLCHIEKVPGQFPGAQIPFSETLKDPIREFLKSHPDHDVTDDPIKVKISAHGAKMSKTTNFMILSFALLQTGNDVMSSSGNRTLAIVNGPEKYNTLASSFATVINDINSVVKNGKINVDVLLHESRQLALKHNERNKRRYEKKDENYWGSEIVDTRKESKSFQKSRFT